MGKNVSVSRDEPPRAPWNHGEERGHEEFPLDGRSAPMELRKT